MHNRIPFLLCIVGGILLIATSTVGSIGFLQLIADIVASIPALEDYLWLINMILYVLLFLAGLGGISVIIGGVLLTGARVGTGKFIIGLGAGMGLIGLVISLIEIIWTSGFGTLVNFLLLAAQSAGWVGATLTIIARQTAKKPQ